MTPDQTDVSTPDRILDAAEALAQTRGFNAFSYAHISAELGITKASLHYHFPSKAELGEALIARYSARFADALDTIDRGEGDARDKLNAYAALYSGVLRGQRMCLCGMLAAEYETLPKPMSRAIVHFFDVNHAWLTHVLVEGRADETLAFDGDPSENANVILGGLAGAMLVARPYADPARFDAAAKRLLAPFARKQPHGMRRAAEAAGAPAQQA
jgi:TetR/AcrR family transcriptional regulator, transcriptional repressor for nem operon